MAFTMANNYNNRLRLEKTQYPNFYDDEAPDVVALSDSDDDSVKQRRYQTKEDQDVAVFMALAQKMSIKSLLHLMQGHARIKDIPAECLIKVSANPAQATSWKKPIPKIKVFRFAEVSGQQVRAVVHEVPSYKDIKSLWWNSQEIRDIRTEALEIVHYFRKHRPEYIETVELLGQWFQHSSQPSQSVVEDHMKKLMQDSFARGLEAHIVTMLSTRRHEIVAAVLEEQSECRLCNDSYDIASECLRDQSLSFSVLSRSFGEKMAQCDHVEALKACLSSWQSERIIL